MSFRGPERHPRSTMSSYPTQEEAISFQLLHYCLNKCVTLRLALLVCFLQLLYLCPLWRCLPQTVYWSSTTLLQGWISLSIIQPTPCESMSFLHKLDTGSHLVKCIIWYKYFATVIINSISINSHSSSRQGCGHRGMVITVFFLDSLLYETLV